MMAVLNAAPVLAEPKGYIREVKVRGEGGFIQSPVVFVIDLQKQIAVISDPITLVAKENLWRATLNGARTARIVCVGV